MNPAWALLAVVAGIGIGEQLDTTARTGLLAGAALAGAVAGGGMVLARAAGFPARGNGSAPGVTVTLAIALALALALAGAAADVRARHGLVDTPLAARAEARDPVTAWVTLLTDPEARTFSARAVARLGDRRVLLSAARDRRSPLLVLGAGDHVLVEGRLQPLDGSHAWWRRRHVVARLVVRDVADVALPTALATRVTEGVRRTVLRGGASLPPPLRALYEGFLVGETRDLPDDLVGDFRASGLSHLLAVSGANVAIVLACLGPLLSRLSLRGRLVAGGGALLVFGSVTRWEPSVLRAVVMAGVSLAAATAGRPVRGLRTLCLAVTALLLADPFLLWSVGFQLSCAACAGIMLSSGPLAARIPGPRAFSTAAATTVAAQLGVTPVLLPVFGSVPLVALPANLLAAPLAGPITVWGLGGGLAAGALAGPLPELGWLVHRPTALLLGAVETVARVAARTPVAVDGRGALGLVAVGCLVVAGWRASRRLDPDGVPDAPPRQPDP